MTMNPDWWDQSQQNTPFMSQQEIDDVLYGIGAGMSDSESGFVRGFGRAMAAVTGKRIEREEKRKAREERLSDLADIEKKQIAAEVRQQERQLGAEARQQERQIAAEQRQEQMQVRKDQRDKQALDELMKSPFHAISLGTATNRQAAVKEQDRQFQRWLSRTLGSDVLRFAGNAPIDPYAVSTPEDKPVRKARGMMRTIDGRMIMAVEDTDQTTPLYGDKGRDYAY